MKWFDSTEKRRAIELFFIVAFIACLQVSSASAERPAQLPQTAASAPTGENGPQERGRAGLVVQIGCGDGTRTAELCQGGRYLVHAIAFEDDSLVAARKTLQSKGLHGPASVERLPLEPLPYANDLANVLWVDDWPEARRLGLSLNEACRVLCPRGEVYLGGERSGEAIAAELAKAGLEKPELVQRHGRAMWKSRKAVRATIDDWTHWRHAPDGNMVSKDREVDLPTRLQWISEPTHARTHAWTDVYMIATMRGIVSAQGRLFTVWDSAPRGISGPMKMKLTARDAHNGLLLWERPLESATPLGDPKVKVKHYTYYWFKRRCLAAVGDRVYTVVKQGGPLVALDAATGQTKAIHDAVGSPEEVVVDGDRLLVIQKRSEDIGWGFGPLACLDANTGKVLWRQTDGIGRYITVGGGQVFVDAGGGRVDCLDLGTGQRKWSEKLPAGASVLCFYQDGRLFLKGDSKDVFAVSAQDGKFLWKYEYKDFNGAFYSDTDIYGVGGLIWCQVGGQSWAMVGLDPATGTESNRIAFPADYPKTRGHHRCHPNRATYRFFLLDTRGLDFVDRVKGRIYDLASFRGACYVGMLPANGLTYLPPNACQCGSYVRGFVALSAGEETTAPAEPASSATTAYSTAARLVKGPVYGGALDAKLGAAEIDWPSYRHDALRSAGTAIAVPTELTQLWERRVDRRITSPTIAGGMVFVGAADAHEVCALDAKTGEFRWRFATGGPVDTPPTIYAGLALVGCRDGWVYCLRASDGALAWQFRAAPRERRVSVFGHLESAWPLHGSVLVYDGLAYVSAGWSSELDGGLYVYALDPATGKVVWEKQPPDLLHKVLKQEIATTGRAWYTAVTVNDIMLGGPSSGKPVVNIGLTGFEPRTGEILQWRYAWFPRSQVLDGTWVGRGRWDGPWGEAELGVTDGKRSIGFVTASNGDVTMAPASRGYKLQSVGQHEWELRPPLRIRAMALTRDAVFAAAIPDQIKEKDYWGAFEGILGSELCAFSPVDGKQTMSLKIDAMPVFDGLAAAEGKLFLSTHDGKIRCFGKK